MNKERSPNCGGGVGFFVSKKFDFEVLEEESIFVEGVYGLRLKFQRIFTKSLAISIGPTLHLEQV